MTAWMKNLKTTVAILVLLVVMSASVTVTAAGPRVTPKPVTVVAPPMVDLPAIQEPTLVGNLYDHFWLWLTTFFL